MKMILRSMALMALALVASLLVTACTADDVASPTSTTPDPATEQAQAATPAPQGVTVAGRPAEPAGENEDFREDSPDHVAATGRPQLIEVFSYD